MRLVFSTPPEAEPYDVIEGKFNIFALGKTDDDLVNSHKSQGVFLGAYSSDEGYGVINIAESEKPFMKKIIDLREGIKKAVYAIMPDEYGALAVALLIGDKSALPEKIYSDFSTLGISHIISVSGYHLSLWSMLILNLLKKTRFNFRLANLLAALGVVFFMLIAGLSYSVVRSGIMMLVFLIGDSLLRQKDSLNSLGIALAFLAVARPFSMGSVSLQLSALATAGIILCSLYVEPDINKIIDKIKHKAFYLKLKKLVSALLVTVSATVFTLPVAMALDSSFNFLCFAANLIAVPVAGWCMITSAIGAFSGLFLPLNHNLPAFLAKMLCRFLAGFCDWLADFGMLTFRVSTDTVIVILCGMLLLFLSCVIISTLYKPVYSVMACACTMMFTVCFITLSALQSAETKITAVDCGNGTSVVVSCRGEYVLIGAGGTDFDGLYGIIEAVGESRGEINALIVPDADEGSSRYLVNALRVFRPFEVYCGELPNGADLLLSGSEKHSFTDEFNTENIFAKSYIINNNYCTYIKTADISAVVCFDPSFDYSLMPDALKRADIIISTGNLPFNTLQYTDSVYVINADESRAENVYDFYGSGVVCTGGNGNVVLRAVNGALKVERGYFTLGKDKYAES